LHVWGNTPEESPSRRPLKKKEINCFPRSQSVDHVESLWNDEPYTAVIADFEYNLVLLNILGHQAVFEVAIANARGGWILLPTTINHQVSPSKLADLLLAANASRTLNDNSGSVKWDRSRHYNELEYWTSLLARFYDQDSGQTSGCTWGEIVIRIDLAPRSL
jgi:hypothetical protein